MAALSPREVFTKCVAVLKAHETSLIGPDAHLLQFLTQEKIENDDDVDFITDVFLGCVRFTKMLDVVTNGFLASEGRNVLLRDKPMLRVTTYMAVVVVAATGVDVLDAIFTSLPRVMLGKVVALLRFGWTGDALDTWIKEKWCGLYDAVYVEEQLLGPLAEHRDGIADLCDRIDRRLASTTVKQPAVKITVPKPFNLTKPKVRVLEPIVGIKPKAKVVVPKSTYKTPIELEALERKRRMNRKKAEQRRQAAEAMVSARLVSAGESDRTRQLREELAAREEAELTVKIKAKPLPAAALERADLPVKLNVGAIFARSG